jgi:hypothetical protein
VIASCPPPPPTAGAVVVPSSPNATPAPLGVTSTKALSALPASSAAGASGKGSAAAAVASSPAGANHTAVVFTGGAVEFEMTRLLWSAGGAALFTLLLGVLVVL